jgi:hypothetical protein
MQQPHGQSELVGVCLQTKEKQNQISFHLLNKFLKKSRLQTKNICDHHATSKKACQDQIRCCSLEPGSSANTYAAI